MGVHKRVLIVDDSSEMRHALCRLFKIAGGFQVCGEAANGAEALQIAVELQPEMIVLDLCMPGMNGLETARELKKRQNPAPIILYSMNADEIGTEEAFACGVAAVVSKSEGIGTLIRKAQSVLQEKKAEQAS